MSSREVWHFEKVSIKDSEYAQKCGLKGDCYFWVSKGLIKIEQLDRKTSFQITVSHIRNWGASSKIFFLELGTRSPTGHGRLEMSHKDPNFLRLLVRDTTSSSKRKELPPNKTEEATDEYPYDSYESDSCNSDGYASAYFPRRKNNSSGDGDGDYEGPVKSTEMSKEKWYKKKTTESEESEGAIKVGKKLSGTHVEAGEANDVYRMPMPKKQSK